MVGTILKMSLRNLVNNRLRSLLTVIGVVFGTAAVIATLSSNEGASRFIQSEIKKIGTNVVTVDTISGTPISDAEVELLETFFENGKSISLSRQPVNTFAIQWKGESKPVQVVGVESDYFRDLQLNLASGRALLDSNHDSEIVVGILGGNSAKAIFGDGLAVGNTIPLMIGKDQYLAVNIVGVLENKGGALGALTDNALFLPEKVAGKIGMGLEKVSLVVTLKDEEKSVESSAMIRALLTPKFGESLVINDSREAVERTKKIWGKQNLVGIILASISLVTGGIGIMNVMLMSISQRRKEIGIRKAVGAGNGSIFLQFLSESVVVCVGGGAVGIAIGVFLGQNIAALLGQWDAVVSWGPVLVSMGSAVGVGVVFGILPAIRASKLDPFEALRT